MSETPRTDAAEYEAQIAFESFDGLSSAPQKTVDPAFARQLERELATAETARIICNQNAESWRQAYTDEHTRRLQLQESLNAQTDELRMLREDKARLDWILSAGLVLRGEVVDIGNERAAIDAARKATP